MRYDEPRLVWTSLPNGRLLVHMCVYYSFMNAPSSVCVFITADPIIKLFPVPSVLLYQMK
jgi:hypothetical protein